MVTANIVRSRALLDMVRCVVIVKDSVNDAKNKAFLPSSAVYSSPISPDVVASRS
jgi:hypothetical protein